jgi:DNA-binding XRE family transcriptional regulator
MLAEHNYATSVSGGLRMLLDEDFRDDLKAWRARVGYTQRQAAEALGVELRTLHNWELGRYSPSAGVALRLAMQGIEKQLAEQAAQEKKERRRVVRHS